MSVWRINGTRVPFPQYWMPWAKKLVWLSLGLSMAGCTLGPIFSRPGSPNHADYSSAENPLATSTEAVAGRDGQSQRFVKGLDLPAQWWQLFRSPSLNELIEQALKNNNDLKAAQAALRLANENVKAQQGFFFPTVQAGVSPNRQRNAVGTLSPTLASGNAIYNLYTSQVAISYAPDVFGLNRRLVESLKAQAEFQSHLLQATYVTLTANVAQAAVQEASLRSQIQANESLIKIQKEQLSIFNQQLNLGAVSMNDIAAQEAQLAQTQALLPPLKQQLSIQRNLLTALSGQLPQDSIKQSFELNSLHLPDTLPVSLPSSLVDQRPDVRAAEATLHSATAQIGVAMANRLPQFSITAAAGGASTVFSQMFRADNVFWGIASSATQTLFDGRTLLHRKLAAEAAFEQAAAQYRSTVVGAFQNVADALRALEYDAQALKAQSEAEQATAKSLSFAQKGFELGSVSYLAVLNAQQAYQQSLIGVAQARASRYADSIALFQALGGGWWNNPELNRLEK